jgi:hypothetical protein
MGIMIRNAYVADFLLYFIVKLYFYIHAFLELSTNNLGRRRNGKEGKEEETFSVGGRPLCTGCYLLQAATKINK